MENQESEFGKGFIYNLILFAKHWGSINIFKETDYSLWFNGAGDHFFGFEVPSQWQETELGNRFTALKDLVLRFRLSPGQVTEEDFEKVFKELEELVRLVDKELGVEAIKATWN